MKYAIQRKSDGLFYAGRENKVEIWTNQPTNHNTAPSELYLARIFSNLYKIVEL